MNRVAPGGCGPWYSGRMFHNLFPVLGRSRARIARLALVVAAVVIVAQVYGASPRETRIELVLGPSHLEVIEVRLAYLQRGVEYKAVRFSFPGGAPPRIPHRTDLPAGHFEVNLWLTRRSGSVQRVVRALDTPTQGDGPIVLPLDE